MLYGDVDAAVDWLVSIRCPSVDDVDRHHPSARASGATNLRAPADQFHGDRTYRVEDPEGGHWPLAQRVRDVAPEDLTGH